MHPYRNVLQERKINEKCIFTSKTDSDETLGVSLFRLIITNTCDSRDFFFVFIFLKALSDKDIREISICTFTFLS